MMLKLGSLFTGGGGLDDGMEQAGFETVWQVEYDDEVREELSYLFPKTEKFKDVRNVGYSHGEYSPYPRGRARIEELKLVDVICGGFPCQDVSIANINGKGLDGERSGLWSEYKRILCELRPRYALIENVAELINRGLDRVLCDLAEIGYDAEWQTLRASTFGLPHQRNRFFIIAYPSGVRRLQTSIFNGRLGKSSSERWSGFSSLTIGGATNLYPSIPEHLRVDSGFSYELSEIENAIRCYGNSVAPPVAKFLGELIIKHAEAAQ